MTSFVLPRLERPAVRAKGTVRPSEKPMMTSRRTSVRSMLEETEEEDSEEESACGRYLESQGRSMAGSAGMRGVDSDGG